MYDNPSEKMYPLAVDAAGEDPTYVGRIREDDTIPNGLNMWIVADNIRKGAALNAVQIAEELVRRDCSACRIAPCSSRSKSGSCEPFLPIGASGKPGAQSGLFVLKRVRTQTTHP